MIRRTAAALALAACLANSARAGERTPDPVDAWIEKQHADGALAAAARAEIHGAELAARGYGRRAPDAEAAPDGDTQFQIGSITKVYTHLLLAEMNASGDARYAQTIGELLPRIEPSNPKVAGITLRALATHRSGLPRLPANLPLTDATDPYGDYGIDDLLEGLEQARAKQPLGSYYAYSNLGVGVLGHLLGKAHGSDYRRAVAARVIAPLHLERTGFTTDANAAAPVSGGKRVPAWTFQDAFAGAGALWGSVTDLGRLVQAYLGEHDHALKHDLRADLQIEIADAGPFSVTRVWHVAHAGAQPIYWHNGGTAGFHSFVGFRPDQRRGIAILVSGDADPTAIGLEALGHEGKAPVASEVDDSVLGQYRITEAFGIGVYARDGVLLAQASGQSPLQLHAVGDDWYALGEVDASLRFVRDDAGVSALELAQNGVVQKATRVSATAEATTRREVELDAETLAAYVGAYAFAPNAVLTVKRAGHGLEAQLTGQPYFPIHASARDRFFYKVVDAELQFERNGNGAIDAVVLHQGGVEQRAKRTR